jgi:hypothetical protein
VCVTESDTHVVRERENAHTEGERERERGKERGRERGRERERERERERDCICVYVCVRAHLWVTGFVFVCQNPEAVSVIGLCTELSLLLLCHFLFRFSDGFYFFIKRPVALFVIVFFFFLFYGRWLLCFFVLDALF